MSEDDSLYLPHGLSIPHKQIKPVRISISTEDVKTAMHYIIEIHKDRLCKKPIHIDYLYFSDISYKYGVPSDKFQENDLSKFIKKCAKSDYIGVTVGLIRVKLNKLIKMYGPDILNKINGYSISEVKELDVNNDIIDYHLNMVIIDNKNKEIERFEPIGTIVIEQTCNIDSILTDRFKEYKYFSPIDFCPNLSFQGVDKLFRKQLGLPKEPGMCAIWSLWYLDSRLLNPSINRGELIESILDRIKIHKSKYIQDIIYGYWYNLVKFIYIIKQEQITYREAIDKMYSLTELRPIKKHKKYIDLNID